MFRLAVMLTGCMHFSIATLDQIIEQSSIRNHNTAIPSGDSIFGHGVRFNEAAGTRSVVITQLRDGVHLIRPNSQRGMKSYTHGTKTVIIMWTRVSVLEVSVMVRDLVRVKLRVGMMSLNER